MTLALPGYAKPDLWLDNDNAIELVRWKDDPEPYRAVWWHRSAKSETGWCAGGLAWRNPAPERLGETALWTLHSREPLTLSPSLLCLTCGAHGFIRDGKWQPA
jgi:hypothetical protein